MGRRLPLLLILLLAFATNRAMHALPQAAATTGTVQGTVTREGTTEPIPDVQITLSGRGYGQSVMSPQNAQSLMDAVSRGASVPDELVQQARETIALGTARGATPPASYTAVSDNNGHFLIPNVPIGDTTARAQLQGYFGPMVGSFYSTIASASATVAADKPADIHLSMLPGGTISGRVTDSNGKPFSDLQVFVVQPGYNNGKPALQPANLKNTDDRGEYRMYRLPPGDYFIAVSPRSGARGLSPAVSGEVPVKTFYPGVTDPSRAVSIALKAGDDLTGVNLSVMTGMAATISGKVISSLPAGPVINSANGASRDPIAVVAMTLHDPDALPDFSNGNTVTANATDGTFQIPNVPPGIYDLFVRAPIAYGWGGQNPPERATGASAIGRTTVEVRGLNVENVSLPLSRGVDVKGRVSVDGKPSLPNLRLSLLPADNSDNVPDGPISNIFNQVEIYQVKIDQDGSFTYPVLPPARYRFNASFGAPIAGARGQAVPAAGTAPAPVPIAMPASAYLADIRQDGVSVYDNDFVIGTQAVAPLDVIVKTDGGSIDGKVVTIDRKPAAAGITVVLIPPENRRQNGALYKQARTDAQGHFVMNAVPPGVYTIYAWETMRPGAYQNAEYLRQFEGRGASVTVSASSKGSAEVVLIK